MTKESFPCPSCGAEAMVRKPLRRRGWYMLECGECGLRRGPLRRGKGPEVA